MILLDTHIWVRWLISGDLKAEIVALIENAAEVAVSSISCWEVAYLAKRGRIKLPVSLQQWIELGLYKAQVSCLPVDQQVAVLAANLPDHHRDPADRIIIATAITYGFQLISLDNQFCKYDELQGILIPTRTTDP
jgi:PIN domain nuclease of toxin-antitoxin system